MSAMTDVGRKHKCTDLWPLMSQVVRLGLDHRQDKHNPEVEQVGDPYILFLLLHKE